MDDKRVFYPRLAHAFSAGSAVRVLGPLVLPAGIVVRALEPPVQCVGEGDWPPSLAAPW